MQNGIGIDINAIGAMPSPVGVHAQPQVAVAPTPFEMPQVAVQPVAAAVQPQVTAMPGVIHNTTVSTAPIEAPSTMVMGGVAGVTPIMNTPFEMPGQPLDVSNIAAQPVVQAAPTPFEMPQVAPVIQATALTPEQIQVINTQNAPQVYAQAQEDTTSVDMAGLGIETTTVVSTTLPTPAQVEAVEAAATIPLSAAEEQGLISRMSASQYDNFIKILDSINSDTNALVNNISNGAITLLREGGTLTTKINHIFGDKSWVFNNPGVQLKRLKFAKSEGETIIMNDNNNDILVAKNKKGETTNIIRLSQIDEDFLPPSLAKDYGERKYSCLLEKEQVKKLVDARASYEKTTYHITVDKNSNEIVKLHLGEDYIYPLLNDASRELKTYTVTQLFPIVEEAYISMYINDRNEVSFKTSVDVYNATISFHIGADEYIQSIVANLQI